MHDLKRKYLIVFVIVIAVVIIPLTFAKYTTSINNKLLLSVAKGNCFINFNNNDGVGEMPDQEIGNDEVSISKNLFTREGYKFVGWNTKSDGTGDYYSDEQLVKKLSSVYGNSVTLYAQWVLEGIVAEIDGVYFGTLQSAIDSVALNTSDVTIKVLDNINENITVKKNQNIILNLQSFALNNATTGAVIENYGSLYILGGSVNTYVTTDGAINNRSSGKLVLDGVKMYVITGGKQAVYNDKGTLEIKNDCYLVSESSIRATVQNVSPGNITITGGTIISNNFDGLVNAGTMIVGVKDGEANKDSILIQGVNYGINSSTNFNYYGGTIKGKKGSFNNVALIKDQEEGLDIANYSEVINNATYKVSYLANIVTVNFDSNGGTLTDNTLNIEVNEKIGELPIPTRNGYVFLGWYTDPNGGEKISKDTIVVNDVIYYAHWEKVYAAMYNEIKYDTIQQAIDAVENNNVLATIDVAFDRSENITISEGKNILLNLQDCTLSNSGNSPVITNEGTLSIKNGTVTSNADYATINNNGTGVLLVSGGRILATGTRSAIYNIAGGTVTISGDAYLSSTATGKVSASSLERGTIHNLKGGFVTIKGGTIVAQKQQAISNEGSLVVGVADGVINNNSLLVMGKTYGIRNKGTFEFYDGTIKGVSGAIDGDITNLEDGSLVSESEEVIDGETYKVVILNK